MTFNDSGKIFLFCLFSCVVHVAVFSMTPQPQAIKVQQSEVGVSFVQAAVHSFIPKLESRAILPSIEPSEMEPLFEPSVPEPKVNSEDKIKPNEKKLVPEPEVVMPENTVVEPKEIVPPETIPLEKVVSVNASSQKVFQTGEGGEKVELPLPAKVPTPDFASIDQLFSSEVSDFKSAEANRVAVDDTLKTQSGSADEVLPQRTIQQALPLYEVNPEPVYPHVARSRGWQGSVLLEVTVGSDGRVEKIATLESSGYRVLDKAARKTVYRWKFKPANIGGVAMRCTVKVPIDFHLKSARG